jgi:hypothetical protein
MRNRGIGILDSSSGSREISLLKMRNREDLLLWNRKYPPNLLAFGGDLWVETRCTPAPLYPHRCRVNHGHERARSYM